MSPESSKALHLGVPVSEGSCHGRDGVMVQNVIVVEEPGPLEAMVTPPPPIVPDLQWQLQNVRVDLHLRPARFSRPHLAAAKGSDIAHFLENACSATNGIC